MSLVILRVLVIFLLLALSVAVTVVKESEP